MQIIIRSVGERTVPLILKQHPDARVVEHVTPFAEALRVCFEMALSSGEKQAVFIDGDVMPDISMADKLCARLQSQPDALSIAPRMYDLLTGTNRVVGVHAYNVKYLHEALEALEVTRNSMRPESRIRNITRRTRLTTKAALGIHGAQQYYADIYRTVLLWTAKHAKHERMFHEYWASSDSADFTVARLAWRDGKRLGITRCDASISIDIDSVLAEAGLTEKEPLCV